MTDSIEYEFTLERAERVVAYAMEAFDTAVEALRDSLRVLQSMPDTGDRDVVKDIRAMNTALMLTIDLQEKARVAGSKRFGADHGAGRLDLDGARDEIAMRLACLRAAGDADGVSGGAE